MSPCTVATTLAQFPNLNANVLRGICKGLHPSPDDAPEGFSLNDSQYPMLYITVAPQEMRPAYWIQETSDGKVLGRYWGQPATKDPWVFEVYTELLLEPEYPITAIPSWYRHLALGPSAGFTMLAEATAAAGHPGLLAEVLHWRHLDEQLQGTRAKLEALKGDILALQSNMGLCELCLIGAQAHQHILTLEKVSKSGAHQYYATLRTTKKGTKQGCFV
jgi:hypothetical protein